MAIEAPVLRQVIHYVLVTNFTNDKIGLVCGIAPNTVKKFRQLCTAGEWRREQIDLMDDKQLDLAFRSKAKPESSKVMPDYAQVFIETGGNVKKGSQAYKTRATAKSVHYNYQQKYGERALCYSQFNYWFRVWKESHLSPKMRQFKAWGEVTNSDYAGPTISYTAPKTGLEKQAQIFFANIARSNLVFSRACDSQKVQDWIDNHIATFEYAGAVTPVVTCDNLKAAVTKPGLMPILNRSFLDMARHYGPEVIPSRPGTPTDNASAEKAVQDGSHWILSELKKCNFSSIDEINEAILALLPRINDRELKPFGMTRRELFETYDKPAMLPLPRTRYQYGEWFVGRKVPKDYLIYIHKHWYSVPHYLIGQKVDVRVSANLVEIFHLNKRVASHVRVDDIGGFTVDKNHMPANHRAQSEKSRDHYLAWAKSFGGATQSVVERQFENRSPKSIQGITACMRLKSIARHYESHDFEAACQRSLDIGSPSAKSIDSILRHSLQKADRYEIDPQIQLPIHENVRGSEYYSEGGI